MYQPSISESERGDNQQVIDSGNVYTDHCVQPSRHGDYDKTWEDRKDHKIKSISIKLNKSFRTFYSNDNTQDTEFKKHLYRCHLFHTERSFGKRTKNGDTVLSSKRLDPSFLSNHESKKSFASCNNMVYLDNSDATNEKETEIIRNKVSRDRIRKASERSNIIKHKEKHQADAFSGSVGLTLNRKAEEGYSSHVTDSFDPGGDFYRNEMPSSKNDSTSFSVKKMSSYRSVLLPLSSSDCCHRSTMKFEDSMKKGQLSVGSKRSRFSLRARPYTTRATKYTHVDMPHNRASIRDLGCYETTDSQNHDTIVGVKRKRGLEDDTEERRQNVPSRGSFQAGSPATLKIRHPRSRRNQQYGWSSNAHHHRPRSKSVPSKPQHAVASFTLGALPETGACSKQDPPGTPHPTIELSHIPSPCRAVVRIPAETLLSKVTTDGTQKFPVDGEECHILKRDAYHNMKSKHGCSPKECFPLSYGDNPLLKTRMPQATHRRKSRRHIKDDRLNSPAVTPTHYHAYFKSDSSSANKSDSVEDFNKNIRDIKPDKGQDKFNKWDKCLTVDPENNIKCMVSLCEDKHESGESNLSAQNNFETDKTLIKRHHIHHRLEEDADKAIMKSSPFGKPHNRKVNKALISRPSASAKGKTLTSQPSHSYKSRSPKQRPKTPDSSRSPNLRSDTISHPSALSEAIEESQETTANLDILKAPILCPVHKSNLRPNRRDPPSVSLESRQLVYLYKLALKKVGVGFHMSPVDPKAAHFPLKCLVETDQVQTMKKKAIPHSRNSKGHPSSPYARRLNVKDKTNVANNKRQSLSEDTDAGLLKNSNRIDLKTRPSPRYGDLDRFYKEYPSLSSSPSMSSTAHQASSGYSNRSSLHARPADMIHTNNIVRSSDDLNSLAVEGSRDKIKKTEKRKQNHNYQFISSSPKRHTKSKIERDETFSEMDDYNKNQGSYLAKETLQNKQWRSKEEKANANNWTNNLPASTIDSPIKFHAKLASNMPRKHSVLPRKITVLCPTTKPKEDAALDRIQQKIHSPEKEKHALYGSTLSRLENVVQKLSNVLEMSKSPPKQKSIITDKIKLKSPRKSIEKAFANKKPTPKVKKLYRQSIAKHGHSPPIQPNSKANVKSVHYPVLFKRRSFSVGTNHQTTQTLPGKSLAGSKRPAKTPTPVETTKVGPLDAWVTRSSQRKKNTRGLVTNEELSSVGRAGPPRLRTAARAAAKITWSDPDKFNNTSRKHAENFNSDLTRKVPQKRAKSCSFTKYHRVSNVPSRVTSPPTKRSCSVGIQWPSLLQENRDPLCAATPIPTRRSPKHHNVSLHNLHGSPRRRFLLGIKEKHPCEPVSPWRHNLNRASDWCQGKSRIRSFLRKESSAPSLSWSVSVDTSWDVSAGQVFD